MGASFIDQFEKNILKYCNYEKILKEAINFEIVCKIVIENLRRQVLGVVQTNKHRDSLYGQLQD